MFRHCASNFLRERRNPSAKILMVRGLDRVANRSASALPSKSPRRHCDIFCPPLPESHTKILSIRTEEQAPIPPPS
jgi:hypothetical protein